MLYLIGYEYLDSIIFYIKICYKNRDDSFYGLRFLDRLFMSIIRVKIIAHQFKIIKFRVVPI